MHTQGSWPRGCSLTRSWMAVPPPGCSVMSDILTGETTTSTSLLVMTSPSTALLTDHYELTRFVPPSPQHGVPPQRLRAVRSAAPGRTPLRRGRRCRARARRARAVPVSATRRSTSSPHRIVDEPYGAVAEHVPVHRGNVSGYGEGGPCTPGRAAAHRARARSPRPSLLETLPTQHLQLRLGRRVGRQPHDADGRRAPGASRWVAARAHEHAAVAAARAA